ncbi:MULTISPECIES: WxL domain-containing protein [Levilactobacillus]|uniref:WxL domain-containing protein n=1 Tax=Levilactobacillus TaxID=2767886 RepID=UPI00195173BA|nr:WxL domain-containing protein [Levilactobacillus sp. 244-2]
MKLKKILLQLGLLLAFVGVGMIGYKSAYAQAGTDLQSDAALKAGIIGRSPSFVDGDSKGFTTSYPAVTEISADGVQNGRVTTGTRNIYISYDTTVLPTIKYGAYTQFYADVMTYPKGSIKPTSLSSKAPQLWKLSNSNKSATPPYGVLTIPVDFSHLGANPPFPIYIGFVYSAAAGSGTPITNYYYEITINGDSTAISKLKDVTINDGKDLSSSDKIVKGTGEPGMTVTLSGASKDYTSTIGNDGTYEFDLDDTLKNSGSPSSIKVTESNIYGDSKSAEADVKDTYPLSITATTPSVGVSPDQLASLAGKSDDEILKWLAGSEAAGLVVTKESDPTSVIDPSSLTYNTTETGLLSEISSATESNPATISVGASDASGDKTSSTTAINVYPTNGIFKFGLLSDYYFGTLPVPSRETLFAPTNEPSVPIQDTQTVGKGWRVTASSTRMHDKADNTYLNGKLVYVDASGNLNDLTGTSPVQVGSGTRQSGQNSVEVASGWAKSGQTVDASKFAGGAADTSVTPGIYLDAQPNIYATSATTGSSYVGILSWTLTNSVS